MKKYFKKALVVFYSRTNTTKIVAYEIAKHLNSDIEEIVDLKSRIGFFGYINAGSDAFKRKKTKIVFNKDLSKYSLVVVGTPVWAGNITPAIRTYLEINKGKIKNCAFFLTYGSLQGKCFDEMQFISGKKPLATISMTNPEVRENNYRKYALEFCNVLKKKLRKL